VVENIGSAKVIEKCGYHLEGTFESYLLFKGKWWDVKQFKMLRAEWEGNKND
jgi:RimJ/RimL family protein N-acetyltransferase